MNNVRIVKKQVNKEKIMDKDKLTQAIKELEEKIDQQGHIVNARDSDHLINLKKILKELK